MREQRRHHRWVVPVVSLGGAAGAGARYALELGRAHPLARPFLGVGVLGGYTTFSTYTVQTRALLADGLPLLGMAYLLGTLVVALVAVSVGVAVARSGTAARRWGSRRARPGEDPS